jgi:hypothetical protein
MVVTVQDFCLVFQVSVGIRKSLARIYNQQH